MGIRGLYSLIFDVKKGKKLNVKGVDVVLLSKGEADYLSLTDIAGHRNREYADKIVHNWMRIRSTVEFLGLWEKLNNIVFKPLEFEGFKNEAGANSFVLTPKKWVETTGAIGLFSKSGRYGGGTFAHKDIAFEFASWLSPEFKLYLIKEFQRLKDDESKRKSLDWDLRRSLSRINYRIHTDAIKEHLIPKEITSKQVHGIYASEADVLNVALFGMTAKDWRDENPDKDGNIRDYATMEQLVLLSNLESINALLLEEDVGQPERLMKLNKVAITQMRSLLGGKGAPRLGINLMLVG